ncbi:TM214 protein, partial [Prunella himalayana]|nr:TM214 protein [Prunella himalayana]
DYPYCLVSKELRGIIRSLLAKASDCLELFFDHCIYTMLQELDKAQGESLHGYRICIQALLLYRPRIATTNLGKYLEVLRSQQSRPAKCLTVLWALGQAGFTDLHEGLKVWLGVMLPVLGIKSLSPYAVSYLDRLLMMHPNLTKGFGMIGPKDFFPLLDFAFMPNNSLSPSLQEQLRRLYPRLKVLALGARPEAALHTYFPSFLSRATPACPPAMKDELLSSMSQCLSLDPLSFGVWRQLYTKHLAQSRSVHTVPPRGARAHLQTPEFFLGIPDQAPCSPSPQFAAEPPPGVLGEQQQEGRAGQWDGGSSVPAKGRSGALLSLAASSCARLLRSSGALPAAQLAWQKLSRACLQGYRWLEHSLAQQGSGAVSVLWPQLELLWRSSAEAARAVSLHCCSLLSWLHGSLPWLSDWLRSRLPEALLHLAECVRELLLFVLHSCLLPLLQGLAAALQRGWQRCLDSCNGDVTWECVRDHLTSFTYSSWIYLQNATLALKNWALAMISGH